jgi:hypothetical protein
MKIEKHLYSFDNENGNTCIISSFSVKFCAVVSYLLHFQLSFVRAQFLAAVVPGRGGQGAAPRGGEPVAASTGTCFFIIIFY